MLLGQVSFRSHLRFLTKVDHTAGFLVYITFVAVFSLYMIYRVVPTHGTRNPMVYLSICSLVGSVSVMAIKVSFPVLHLLPLADFALQGFGVAIKLTLSGNNQLTHVSTYVFGVVVVGCIVVQMVCRAQRKKIKRRNDFS